MNRVDRARQTGIALLVLLGVAQMAGDITGLRALKALAAATGASPAPKVFSAVQGLETYSTRFYLEPMAATGGVEPVLLTPQMNARLRGPYNRRNVYGAVLAYGPVLMTDPHGRPMFEAVASYALCGEAPLLQEMGLRREDYADGVVLRLQPRPGNRMDTLPTRLEIACPR